MSRALRRSGAALTICCRHPEKTAGWNMETRLWRELPLLAAGSEVLWVCGAGFAEGLAPDEGTAQVLQMEMEHREELS